MDFMQLLMVNHVAFSNITENENPSINNVRKNTVTKKVRKVADEIEDIETDELKRYYGRWEEDQCLNMQIRGRLFIVT